MANRHFDPYFFVNKLIYINAISNVAAGSVDMKGEHHEFSVKRSDIPEGGKEEDRLYTYRFDGELVEDDLFLALYRALIELIPSYEIRGEKPVYDESQKVEVHYQFWDGTEETFTFYKLDDFYYVIQVEEDVWFACDYERFQRVEERIADLMAAVGK